MSLHLGNLSPRTRKDELEHAFRRFGRCTVRLKDGYGFAVYDSHGDAKAALTSLKGRKICGQTIDLSWSNKQPKPLQRFSKAMHHGRNSDRVDNYISHIFSRLHDDRASFNHINKQKEEFVKESARVESNQMDTGRWGEEVDSLQNENDVDEWMGFDRYEANCGDERGEEYENHAQPSLDKNRRVHHPDITRGHQTCFRCGASGHKMRDCPLEGAPHGRKAYHLDHRHGKEAKSRSRERLWPSNRNPRSARPHETDRNIYHSERNGTNDSSLVENESSRMKRKDYDGKRRREKEDQTVEKLDDKKSRRLPKPSSGSISLSRSGSPSRRSLSVSSKSKSRSNNSKSKSIKSKCRSRSRSRSRTLSSSLSVSLGQSLSSSPNKEVWAEVRKLFETDESKEKFPMENTDEACLSGYIDNATSHLSKKPLTENQQLEFDSMDKNPTSTNYIEQLQSEDVSSSLKVGDNIKMNQLHNDETNSTLPHVSCETEIPSPSSLPEKKRESEALENAEDSKMMESSDPVKKSDPRGPCNSNICGHLSISSEELQRVIKHYGLRCPDEDEQLDNVEDYLGSARLWPWEMIYYRRLKKGSVSKENYDRRVAQNTAFGINDKYIRSCSGWFESIDEHP